MNKKFLKILLLVVSLSLFAISCSSNNPTNPGGEGTTPPSGSKKATIKIKVKDDLIGGIVSDIESIRFNNQTFTLDSFDQVNKEVTIPDNGDYVYVKLKIGTELKSRNIFTPIENGDTIMDTDETVFIISKTDSMDYYDPNGMGKTISDTIGNFINNYGVIEFKNNTGFININNLVWETDQLLSSTFANGQSFKVFAKPATGKSIGITLENSKGGSTTGELKGPYQVIKGEVTTVELTSETPAKSGAIDSTLYNVYADKLN
ncbi:hypothetical protein Bint_2519 [Brachyspira intermedia PWS/A]|uniref:Lipoprotein n=1 Tax=Brachyspira intermedia (strain ATCC 51140 / PWS/A) TaxID=1045858 RepID=G0ENP3_BRAIP|nr:hypothetical protein [Brachyspira intermedia]AEM23123.1 hypothetical protein Bint_2519 [Brachyspira intermedia PWS/A]